MQRLITMSILFLALSCSDAGPREDTQVPTNPNNPNNPSTPGFKLNCSWDGGINKIFEQQCGSCHPGGTQTTNYKTYSSVKAGINSVMDRINDGTMPPGGMKAADKKLVTDWVTAETPKSDSDSETCKTE